MTDAPLRPVVCRHCGVEVQLINYALGVRWMHVTYPYRTRDAYDRCKAPTYAEPATAEPAPDVEPATAPTLPECDPERVETMARAMHEVSGQPGVYGRIPWDRLVAQHRDAYRGMVRAAIAADPSSAEEAAHEVECPSCGTTIRARMADADPSSAELEHADDLRAALASPAPAPNPPEEAVRCGRGYTDSEHWIDGYYACPGFASPAPAPQGEEGQR